MSKEINIGNRTIEIIEGNIMNRIQVGDKVIKIQNELNMRVAEIAIISYKGNNYEVCYGNTIVSTRSCCKKCKNHFHYFDVGFVWENIFLVVPKVCNQKILIAKFNYLWKKVISELYYEKRQTIDCDCIYYEDAEVWTTREDLKNLYKAQSEFYGVPLELIDRENVVTTKNLADENLC